MAMEGNHTSELPSNARPAEKANPAIRVDGSRTVLPAHPSQAHRIPLSCFDARLLLIDYDQKGLLYYIPANEISSAITRLEKSLSQVLTSFYPLAGRLATSPSEGTIYIDCNDAGAEFIEASAPNLTVGDLQVADVPAVVDELFPLNDAFNIQGHRLPLLAVQVTKLGNGIFVGCSLSHCTADGASLWHFFNFWAEICRGKGQNFSFSAPIYDRSLISSSPDGNGSSARLGLDPNAEITKWCPPHLRVKFFHFTEEVMKKLKDRANSGKKSEDQISSLQALCAHVWRAVTRARGLGSHEPTRFQLSIDCRSRLDPPLPPSYFDNAILNIGARATAGDVCGSDFAVPAKMLHDVIKSFGDVGVRERIDRWVKKPFVPLLTELKSILHLGSSPRFRIFETDIGWGQPVAVRSGCANQVDGKLHVYPGGSRDRSVDLEICLVPKTMSRLERDQYFLDPLLVESA